MMAGIPGSGIGGLFYLLSALWMPVKELGLTLRGRSSWLRWKLVGLMSGIAMGVVGVVWLSGWVLGLVLPASSLVKNMPRNNVITMWAVYGALATLGVVLGSVHVLRWFLRRPKKAVQAKKLVVQAFPLTGQQVLNAGE
jgi:hypothetical protein